MTTQAKAAVLLAALVAAVFAFGLAWAEKYETESGEVEDFMELQHSDIFTDPKRGPVPFSHRAHHEYYGVKCEQCHHMFDNGENIWQPGDDAYYCSDCHTEAYQPVGGVRSLHQAFHRNCIDCHLQTDSAPRTCEECHQ
jgi:hypothetical protein